MESTFQAMRRCKRYDKRGHKFLIEAVHLLRMFGNKLSNAFWFWGMRSKLTDVFPIIR